MHGLVAFLIFKWHARQVAGKLSGCGFGLRRDGRLLPTAGHNLVSYATSPRDKTKRSNCRCNTGFKSSNCLHDDLLEWIEVPTWTAER